MKKVHIKDRQLFVLIVALSTLLRFYRFPSLPAGLLQDEASAGYETYALLLRGTDRWGNPKRDMLVDHPNKPLVRDSTTCCRRNAIRNGT